MKVKETELPGVGKKISITTQEGITIAVVVHFTGKREIFIFEEGEGDEDPEYSISLTEEEANQLGSILMGTYFKPEQEREKKLMFPELCIHWKKIGEDSPLVGRKIGDRYIKHDKGILIVAVIRGNEVITNPKADEVLRAGDIIVISGDTERVEEFIKEAKLQDTHISHQSA